MHDMESFVISKGQEQYIDLRSYPLWMESKSFGLFFPHVPQ